MIAVFVNAGAVIIGSLLGILLGNRLNETLRNALMTVMGLCTAVIALSSALATNNILCIIISLALGTLLGELLRIDDRIENAGERLKKLAAGKGKGSDTFTEGFVTASLLFCIGSMTIMGSFEAGIHQNYSIIFAKSIIDFISAMAFSSVMGIGVACSAFFVVLFQGALTLIAMQFGSVLSETVITEMSAAGGVILMGMAINMLSLRQERIKVANMLPGIFLPILYLFITGLF